MNKVNISGVNTGKLPKFSDAEKSELLIRIKSGDDNARDEFIKGNLRLVLSVVKKFANRNEPIDDLFQIGCVGLIKAIDNFSLEHNVKFSTYAVPMKVIKRKGKIYCVFCHFFGKYKIFLRKYLLYMKKCCIINRI